MSIVIGGGIFLIVSGYFASIEMPPLLTHDSFDEDLRIIDSDTSEFRIVYDATGGFYTGRNVDPFIQLTVHEKTQNATTIEVTFLDGRIVTTENRQQISLRNEPIPLQFHDSFIMFGKNYSRYTANPYLVYDSSGFYDAKISVKMKEQEPFEKVFSNVVEIKSIDDYRTQKNELYQSGIALMVAGITFIATSPAFAKLFEYIEEFQEKQKNPK